MTTTNVPTYRQRRQDEHRLWLLDKKRECARCGLETTHLLTLIDRDTGEGLNLGANAWGTPRERRDRLAARSLVLCQSCGHRFRRERATG